VQRSYIPKTDGRQRPIGIPALEDKIVQRAVGEVMNAIYEQDFLGFSYGFRPGRNQHMALDALAVGIQRKKVNWVLDADVRAFRHGGARVAEEVRGLPRRRPEGAAAHPAGAASRSIGRRGVVQDRGGDATRCRDDAPLLANIYLHYVLDRWVTWWRANKARGEVYIVRCADDCAPRRRREEAVM